MKGTVLATMALCAVSTVFAQVGPSQPGKTQEDPFADVAPTPASQEAPNEQARSWLRTFVRDNEEFRGIRSGRQRSQPSVGRIRGAEEVFDLDLYGRQHRFPGKPRFGGMAT